MPNHGVLNAPSGESRLARRLGLWASIGVVIGITIGSGIYRTPAVIAGRVPDPVLMLTLWVIGGAISLCGALSFAELAAALPHSGGPYVFIREGLGRLPAFLFGWSQLVLIRASALGAIATVFGEYCLRSFGIDPAVHEQAADYLAIGALVFATVVNIRGVQWAGAIVGATTAVKYGALGLLVLASFILGGTHGGSLAHFSAAGGPVNPGLFGLALVSVLWAYDGFADLSFAAGEVADPQRNLPRALVLGTAGIIGIYLAVNAAYLYLSPIEQVAKSPLIAADTMLAIFGQTGVALVSIIVMISTFSSVNGTMLAAPRIFFALAEDGLFFRPIAKVHRTYRTPYVAILLASALGIAFILMQNFQQLIESFVLAMWPFYALSVVALFRLRRARPDMPRPYRVVGYPIVPALFLLGAAYLLGNSLVASPLQTLLVFGAILLGVPVYFVFFGRRPAASRAAR